MDRPSPGAPAGFLRPTAVMFDVGNVLYGWDPNHFYRHRISEEQRELFFAETGFLAWHETLDGGRCAREATDDLCGRFPHYAHLISAWSEHFHESITGPVEGVHAIVEQLHQAGVPLYALTNSSADFWPALHAQEADFFSRFRGILVSGEVRMLKPDPAIYRLALDRFGLEPGEALFVDDRAVNVAGAVSVGMHGHVFTDAADLRRRLEAERLL